MTNKLRGATAEENLADIIVRVEMPSAHITIPKNRRNCRVLVQLRNSEPIVTGVNKIFTGED
jgi:hypothetical protein